MAYGDMNMSIWDDWKIKAEASKKLNITTPYLDDKTIDNQKKTRRKMTDEEIRMAKTLKKCSLKRTTYHTRMVDSLVSAADLGIDITDRQAWTLRGLYYMYRRQHGDKTAKKPIGWK
jgi:hypothetical protein